MPEVPAKLDTNDRGWVHAKQWICTCGHDTFYIVKRDGDEHWLVTCAACGIGYSLVEVDPSNN
jgi:hypothetical protein